VALKKLLIVDDELENRQALREIFSAEYDVHLVNDGVEALRRCPEIEPDLILLDILMPRMDGLQTCLKLRQLEQTRQTPIIFLTSKAEPETDTFGLELGADDFVAKPFNVEVLKARVRKRLAAPAAAATGEVTQIGEYKVVWDRQEAQVGEEHIALTTKELHLLRTFVENRGRVLSREMILEKLWSNTYITDRTIDSHIKTLRKKIPPLGKALRTIYGAGYRLDL
jgi:DNA-binding response OmpR family regulator